MLRLLFPAKPDTPLADDKAVKGILAELATMEARVAVREIADWLDALAGEDQIRRERRLGLLTQFDDAAQVHVRALLRDFLHAPRLGRVQKNTLWQHCSEFWQALSSGYARCLDVAGAEPRPKDLPRTSLPLLTVRLLRAHCQWLKWGQFHYAPADAAVWENMGYAYLLAVQEDFDRRRVAAFTGAASESSPHDEYLRALMISVSAADRMRTVEIDLAERVAAYLLSSVKLTAQRADDSVYWIDPARPMPPTRLAREPKPSPTLRFLSTAAALPRLEELVDAARSDCMPQNLDLGGQYPSKKILPVLQHLARQWAVQPPTRAHARHAVRAGLKSVSGLEHIRGHIAGGGESAQTWEIEDVSLGGFRVSAKAPEDGQVRLGMLIGLQPEGGSNWLVGVVRRMTRESAGNFRLGIETLSRAPAAVEAYVAGVRTPALLLDAPEPGASVRLVLPQFGYEEGARVTLEVAGRYVELDPAGLIESGEDCDLARYRVVRLAAAH